MEQKKKTIYVIINPVSGTKSKKMVPDNTRSIDPHEYDVHLFMTGYEGHASQIAQDAVDKKVDYVIAVGGDGTINEVAKMLVNTDIIFGIIPSGSGNGLARDLRIPLDHKKAVEIIRENNVRKIDYGIANDNIFFCTCGVGFDAQVSEKVLNQSSRGKLMYAKSMIDVFSNFKPEKYKVTSSDKTFEGEAFLVTCANASQYGNDSFIAPHADIEDGKMDIAILKPLSVMNATQTAIQLMSKNIENNSKLVQMLTSEVVIERERDGVMHLDGNAIQTGKTISVKIINKGLNVLVPKEVTKPRFDTQSFLNSITRWV